MNQTENHGTQDLEKPGKQEEHRPAGPSSLIDTAIYNLQIAQQYIDEAKYRAEHRLICFHHGIALLARWRNVKEKRALARQYLEAAANWSLPSDSSAPLVEGYCRIVAEAFYNLGVIYELDKEPVLAEESYRRALQTAPPAEPKFEGLRILCEFALVSIEQRKAITETVSAEWKAHLLRRITALQERIRNVDVAPTMLQDKPAYIEDQRPERLQRRPVSAAPESPRTTGAAKTQPTWSRPPSRNLVLERILSKLELFTKDLTT